MSTESRSDSAPCANPSNVRLCGHVHDGDCAYCEIERLKQWRLDVLAIMTRHVLPNEFRREVFGITAHETIASPDLTELRRLVAECRAMDCDRGDKEHEIVKWCFQHVLPVEPGASRETR